MTLQLTPPISLGDVEAEFSAPTGTPLGSFLRGGAFVADTASNAGVPTSKPISLGDLLGASKFEFVETNVMTAGVGGVTSGYDRGIIGGMSPLTYVGTGNLINSVQYSIAFGGQLVVELQPEGLGQTLWTRIAFSNPADPVWDETEFFAADAVYTDQPGITSSVWTFDLPGQVRFIDTQLYGIDWP